MQVWHPILRPQRRPQHSTMSWTNDLETSSSVCRPCFRFHAAGSIEGPTGVEYDERASSQRERTTCLPRWLYDRFWEVDRAKFNSGPQTSTEVRIEVLSRSHSLLRVVSITDSLDGCHGVGRDTDGSLLQCYTRQ